MLIQPQHLFFLDLDGNPLDDGALCFGEYGTNPEIAANQITVYFDDGLTIPAAQPINTTFGVPSRLGKIAKLYIADSTDYSVTVRDKNAQFVTSYSQVVEGASPFTVATVAALILLTPASGDVAKTVGYYDGWAALLVPNGGGNYVAATLAHVRSVKSNGAWVPDELIDHYAANGLVWMLLTDDKINIYQAGAKVNNSTDDTLSIRACVAHFDARGGTVKFPVGLCRITDTITINNKYVNLE